MNLKITGLDNGKEPVKEILKLEVLNDCNLKKYLITDTTYNPDGTVSNKHRHGYWFSDKEVKKGDIIYLYSGKGAYKTESFNNKTLHKFYWNLGTCVWNDDHDGAILFEINNAIGKKLI